MEGFGGVLSLLGLLAFVISLIWLIVALIRKKPVKITLVVMGVSAAWLVIGFVIVGIAADGNNTRQLQIDTTDAVSGPVATATPTFAELKIDAETIEYKDLFRNNEKYHARHFYFEGEIVQVLEHGFGDGYDFRVNLGDDWMEDEVIYLADYEGPRLLEGDAIEFVGESVGLKTYEAVLGNSVTIPRLKAVRVVFISDEQTEDVAGADVASDSATYTPTPYPTPTPLAPVHRLTPKQLVTDYYTDDYEALSKYAGNPIEIVGTGIIERAHSAGFNIVYPPFETEQYGEETLAVSCDYADETRNFVEDLVAGDRLEGVVGIMAEFYSSPQANLKECQFTRQE